MSESLVLFVCTVCPDLAVSIANTANNVDSHTAAALSLMYILAQCGATMYFFYAAYTQQDLRRVHGTQEVAAPDGTKAHLRRMCVHCRLFSLLLVLRALRPVALRSLTGSDGSPPLGFA